MNAVLLAGTVLGLVCGLLNAVYVYRLVTAEPPADARSSRLRAGYYALWTFGLWMLFGSYVFVLWLIGAVLYAVFKAFRR